MSRLLPRKALKRKPRPAGQCGGCYAAGLPLNLSVTVCSACRPANAVYAAENIITARKHAQAS